MSCEHADKKIMEMCSDLYASGVKTGWQFGCGLGRDTPPTQFVNFMPSLCLINLQVCEVKYAAVNIKVVWAWG